MKLKSRLSALSTVHRPSWALALAATFCWLAGLAGARADILLTGSIIGTEGTWCCGATKEKAMDGDITTFFDAPNPGNGAWVGLDLGSGISKQVTAVRYYPRSGWAGRMVDGLFQGANAADFSGAVNLFTVTSQPPEGVMTAQTVNATNTFRYVRYLAPDGGYGNVAEVEFYGQDIVPPGVPAAPTGLAAAASEAQVSLSWTPVAGATSYRVKRSTAAAVGPYSLLASGVTVANYPDLAVTNGSTYYYRVSGVNTNGEGPDSVTVSATPLALQMFGVYRELWTGLNTSLGNTLAALTNTSYNPNWPDRPDAGYTRIFTNFETEVNMLDAYGQRVRTFVVPPTNGAYTFWIASDDASALFLSTDEQPANVRAIAGVNSWTSSREWTRETGQQSVPIELEGGRRYYLEAQMLEGSGGDNLAVRWQLPNGTFEEPMTAISPAGTRLIPFTGANTLPAIARQPASLTLVEGSNATFSLAAANPAPVSYQWRLNGINLLGVSAVKSVYTVSNVPLAFNYRIYTCVVSNAIGSVTSAPATLNVIVDTVPPVVTRALNLGANSVQVVFSKAVEAASATNPANYVFTNGLAVTSVTLATNNTTVTLATAALTYGSNYVALINGVRDRASIPNLIATNTPARFTALPYASQDIGNPPIPSTVIVLTNGLNVTASGSDIGGNADQFGFHYQMRSGNFDVSVRLAGLSPTDAWAKAGLMARESLEAGSRFAAALATPAMSGSFFQWRDPPASSAATAGSFPVNYPATWLRLRRVGNNFAGYASYDGQTWTLLGSVTIAMPTQVFFGLAVSSRHAGAATTAQFREVTELLGAPVLGTVVDPHEPLGVSSRRTPIVFSEIMYKPAARPDTNNVEFVELYNSNPFFHDLSGYALAGDISYTFPPGTILPGGAFLVISASPAAMQTVYGLSNVAGPYLGSLKKTGTLQLRDEVGAVLLTVPYNSAPPWPVAAYGAGHSLVLANPSYGEADPRAWDSSDVVGGSPGQMEAFRPSPLRDVVINEFLAHTDLPVLDYVELYNHGNSPVDVSGCILTDDAATNKFVLPPGTVLPARGFVAYTETQLSFALSAAGESLYLKNPSQTRVLDAVQFGGQENGVATGRWPDGANSFYRLAAKTPGTNNPALKPSDVVINELMYHPLRGSDDDQFVELYNRSTNAVNLTGWRLEDGITFSFPSNTVLAADGYLVIARNATRLRVNYANLNLTNCLGNFGGQLSGSGERVVLTQPDTIISTNSAGVVTTNTIQIVVAEVTYGTGGRWGQWSDGGGSSLELIDPRANPRLAANWGDSDETQKSAWTTIEATGLLDNGANYDPAINYAQIGLLDTGECLVDNVEVRAGTSGANLVKNSGFESGLANWSMQGSLVRSSLESTGYLSSRALRLRASDQMWTGANSCQMALNSNSLAAGQTATLRFKARWLRGWPEALLRLNGNWLEATGPLPVPVNLGTPGARNSRAVTNTGPALYEITHTPAVPAASQPVVVTARMHDPDGVQSFNLYYRLDPATNYTVVPMRDDGLAGDAIAQDGTFSATIPAQSAGTIAAFYLWARDSRLATNRFPEMLNDNAPVRECVVRFGSENPPGGFAVYHLWLTQTNRTRWSELPNLSNESHDCTLVTGSRVIYNAKGRFVGSPYHQGFNAPDGNPCHYKWTFPKDDLLLGAASFNKVHQPGNGAGDDASLQREQVANSLLRTLGVPWLNRRHIVVYVNGSRRGSLMEDAQRPDGDLVGQYFPDDPDGFLYKMQPWFEFGPFPSGSWIPFNNNGWVDLMPHTTTGGAKKPARYRYNYLVRRTPDSASNFTNVFSLVDAASSYGTPGYVANMEGLADMENWLRVFAANHAAGNWDSYGAQNAQNLYGYCGTRGTKYSLLMFDFNISIGNSGSWGPGENLFAVNGADPNTGNIYREPAFRRMYWRALQELINGPFNVANSGPLLDAKYSAFLANGIPAENPAAIKSWLTAARSSITAQLAGENASAFMVNSTVLITNNVAYISGTAPVNVKTITVNGVTYPVIWTSVTGWRVGVPLQPGTNQFSLVGVDRHGQPVAGAAGSASAVFNGTVPSPVGRVVINEIMYAPALPGAEYVELYNTSTNISFDLSGYELRGLSYTFPPGSLIGPNRFLTLAANRAAFAAAYGATNPVFDTFSGTLQGDGETLTLLRPGTNALTDLVAAKVKYASAPPWPASAAGSGRSLQLVDPRQDNWRVGNWAVAQSNLPPALAQAATPGATNSVVAALTAFPPLWLNELQAANLSGITNSAGQRTAWLELYNPGSNSVPLSGLYLSDNFTNLAAWAFPTGAVINPGQFKVIFADGLTNLSTLTELHTRFTLPVGAGALALSRATTNSQWQVLDYVTYTNLAASHSYGSLADGQSFSRQAFFYVTPGSTNNGTSAPLPVFINEWMADNFLTLADPADSDYEDWFELYNAGTNTVDLGNCYLTDTLTNKTQFQIPSNGRYVIPPGGWLLVWADNEAQQNSPNRPDLHVNFKLDKAGEAIALLDANGKLVDWVSFGAQTTDVSEGRHPDGGASSAFLPRATPRLANAAPNTAPVLPALGEKFVYPGQTLSFFVNATDADLPPQTLTYRLEPGALAGASVGSATGLFNWTPPLTQAPGPWPVTLRVTDNGLPPLSAGQTFTITVVATPVLTPVNRSGSTLTLGWPTAPGQRYRLEVAEELGTSAWLPAGADLVGTGAPLSFEVEVTAAPQRFFRLSVLP